MDLYNLLSYLVHHIAIPIIQKEEVSQLDHYFFLYLISITYKKSFIILSITIELFTTIKLTNFY